MFVGGRAPGQPHRAATDNVEGGRYVVPCSGGWHRKREIGTGIIDRSFCTVVFCLALLCCTVLCCTLWHMCVVEVVLFLSGGMGWIDKIVAFR
jgi:hypothetical protein